MRFNSNLVPRNILSCATIRRKGVTAEAFYRIKNSLLYVSCSGSKDKATMPEPVSKAHQAKNFAHPRPHHPDGWVNNTASDNHIQKPALAQLILQLISISEADNAIQVNQARPHRLSRLTSYKPHLSQYIYINMSLTNDTAPIDLREEKEEVVKTTSAVGPAISAGGSDGGTPSSSSSHGFIGIIVFLVLLLIASAIAFFFIRRHFQRRRRQAGGPPPPSSFSSSSSQTTSQASLPDKPTVVA